MHLNVYIPLHRFLSVLYIQGLMIYNITIKKIQYIYSVYVVIKYECIDDLRLRNVIVMKRYSVNIQENPSSPNDLNLFKGQSCPLQYGGVVDVSQQPVGAVLSTPASFSLYQRPTAIVLSS